MKAVQICQPGIFDAPRQRTFGLQVPTLESVSRCPACSPVSCTRRRDKEPSGDTRSFPVWNDNKGAPYPRGGIMQGTTDLSVPPKCPARVSHPLRGMALGTLAEIAVRLVISGYIFAVVVYVNASGNWDKDDDLGMRAPRTGRTDDRD